MTDSFRRAAGRKVLSRASAQDLGAVDHLLLDVQRRQIAAVIIGGGKKAQLADWAQLSGFGPDAVMVVDEGALRPGTGRRRREARAGRETGADRDGKRARNPRRRYLRSRYRGGRDAANE